MRILEVCTGSASEALAAAGAGADRIELCRSLSVGGLTPDPAEVARAARCGLPVVALVRIRPGGFVYTDAEKILMTGCIGQLVDAGASAISAGALDGARRIDIRFMEDALEAARGRPMVFHRAFDAVFDREEALGVIAMLGIRRVLTSCGSATALEGSGQIARLAALGSGRIDVIPAGGIRAANIAEVMLRTGCSQVHGSFSRPGPRGEPCLDPGEVSAAKSAMASAPGGRPG